MKKKQAKNNLLYSMALFVFVLFITVTVVFGWFVIGGTQANDFVVQITNISGEVGLKINNVDYGGSQLMLENALPLTEYVFELSIKSSQSGIVQLRFDNVDGNFTDAVYGEGNMADIIAIRYPTTSEDFIIISDLVDNVVLSGVPIVANEFLEIKFILFFNDIPPTGKDINMYQGKTLTIKKLLVEIY